MAEQRERCRFFRRWGTGVCWLIDPDSRTVETFDDTSDGRVYSEGEFVSAALVPGFALDVGALFAILDR
jgi:Uma2 family endonuclease